MFVVVVDKKLHKQIKRRKKKRKKETRFVFRLLFYPVVILNLLNKSMKIFSNLKIANDMQNIFLPDVNIIPNE